MVPETALSRSRIEQIMGRIDDLKAAEIIEAGASEPELLEAKRWMEGDKRTLSDDLPLRPSVVSQLCEILTNDEPDWLDEPPQ